MVGRALRQRRVQRGGRVRRVRVRVAVRVRMRQRVPVRVTSRTLGKTHHSVCLSDLTRLSKLNYFYKSCLVFLLCANFPWKLYRYSDGSLNFKIT